MLGGSDREGPIDIGRRDRPTAGGIRSPGPGSLPGVSHVESALLVSARWLLPSAALAIPMLAIPPGDPLVTSLVHLAALVALLYALAVRLMVHAEPLWFPGLSTVGRQAFGTAAGLSALVTGFIALVTLATSAALRLQPSLQFLQLLSALDIAWVVTASMIGFRWLAGDRAGRLAGAAVAIMCVVAQWRYLAAVGFTADGGWLLRGSDLARLVLPFDTVAAVVAIGSVLLAIRRGQPAPATEQPSPQS